MRIGVALGVRGRPYWTPAAMADERDAAAARRLDAAWVSQGIGVDALTLLAAWDPVPGLEMGTAVVPAQTRHPLVMAQQVATATTVRGPLTLGIGLGHREVLGPNYGQGGPRRVDWLREYLTVLQALLRGEAVDHVGAHFEVRAQLALPPAPRPDIVLAALGPRMLDLAAELTAGTILWRTGPVAVAMHVRPLIDEAAARHGRPPPRVLVGLPVIATGTSAAEHETARQFVDDAEAFAWTLPTYRASFEREGITRASEMALIGTADEIREKVAVLEAAGATDLIAVLHDVGDLELTWAVLGEIAAEQRRAG
ncbi:MAG TPA: LLM class flavin-dependent oxidoreductase [Acidimicrobiales bacterium]|nr:LLM class flavin-dependent oxidoreductase [Acidimicrobiales bacterium]